ncbi:MAG: 2-hydroxyacid dehydrogenase [Burkholderiales bacterium]
MRILFYGPSSGMPSGDAGAWLAGLRHAIPRAEIRMWEEGDHQPADYVVAWKPPLSMLMQRGDLKAIFNLGAGVDGIMQLGEGLPPGVPIVRLDDAGMGRQMAEYVTHAVLRYFRRFDHFDAQQHSGQWRQLKPFERAEFTVGILGMGVLGKRVADALMHFDFPVRGWSRNPKELPGIACFSGADGLDAFLRGSRVVVCALPLTSETRNILGRANLAKLPQGAYVINVGRGEHVVAADLLDLLRDGQIAAATLDVFDQEPLPEDHPYWQESRISLTPHIAAMTLRDDSVRQIAGKISALECGEPITGIVDRMTGY